jgi:hypothetical protein
MELDMAVRMQFADDTPEAVPESWAIVELMGHVRLAGRLTEEERFGAKMGRLDIPKGPLPGCACCKGRGVIPELSPRPNQETGTAPCPLCGRFVTQYFGGSSVYRITPVSEAVARHVAMSNSPAPVSAWDFPKQLPAAADEARPRPAMFDSKDDDEPEADEVDPANPFKPF